MAPRTAITVLLTSVLAGALTLVVPGPAADAAGGTAISTAPVLPFMLTQTGGADDVDTSQIVDPDDPDALRWHAAGRPGVEYWAIPLTQHQQLRITLTHEQGAGSTQACILPWWTSDQNLPDTDCLTGTRADAGTPSSFVYSPARDATVYLAVWDEACCDLDDWSYAVTAETPTDTTLRLDDPTKKARPGRSLTVTGHLGHVVVPQTVTVQRRKWWRTTSWFKPFRTVTTDASGDFHFAYRVPRKAIHGPAFHAVYQGTPGPIGYERSESNTIVFELGKRR